MQPGTRPIIISVDSNVIGYNSRIDIRTNIEIHEAILIRPGFPTHGFDPHQRSIYLEKDLDGQDSESFQYRLTSPIDNFVAPTGWYMLFVNKFVGSNPVIKVPSVAVFIKLHQ
ncbi:hypothetical protein BH10BAC5_BH10BAC5_14060 [soil metagenome]